MRQGRGQSQGPRALVEEEQVVCRQLQAHSTDTLNILNCACRSRQIFIQSPTLGGACVVGGAQCFIIFNVKVNVFLICM